MGFVEIKKVGFLRRHSGETTIKVNLYEMAVDHFILPSDLEN
jgi:hypothetical protein